MKKTIFMGIIVGSMLLASIGVLNASQQVVAKDPDPVNKQVHDKDCDGDGDDGDCVSNTHKHTMNCDDDGCDANSGSTVNDDDSHFNQNCNTHRNDAATGDPDSDCKDNFHDKPAND